MQKRNSLYKEAGLKVMTQLSNDSNLLCELLSPARCPRDEGQVPAAPLAVEKGGFEGILEATEGPMPWGKGPGDC